MKAESLYLFIFVLCIFTLQQCKPDDPCEGLDLSNQNTYYYFPDSTKAQNGMLAIPFDTLTFVSETFDTAIFLLNKITNSFDQKSKRKYTNPGCPGSIIDNYEYFELEYIKLNYKNTRLKFKFILSQTAIVSTGIRLFYIYDNYETQIGSRSLVIANTTADSVFQFGNKKLNSVLYGDIQAESKYGYYNLQFGLLLFKYNNLIWRRII